MIAWAVDTLIAVSLLMLLVLAARRPVAALFGAGWAYALWLLPLVRLFLPPLDLFGGDIALPQHTVILIPSGGEAVAPSSPAGGSGQWIPLLLALWAGGAAVFVSWQQAAYGALMLSLGREGRRGDPPEFGGIPVVASESADGPMAVGFLKRRIVVPLDFGARYSQAERRLALEHELVHHRRGDIWWNLAALAVLALNWFNPIAHFAFRAFRTDQELACDAAVARRTDEIGRHDYALALVKSASRPGQIAACPMYQADQLKRRLRMMKQHRASPARTIGGSVALSGLLVAGVTLSSAGFAREEARPEPRVLVAERGDPSPIISDSEIATLQEKCGVGSVTVESDEGAGRTMVCGNGRVVDDPEVRKIVRDTLQRAEAEMARAEARAAKAEEVVEAAEQVLHPIPIIPVERHERAREAIARAQAQLRRVDMDAHMEAARMAMANARVQVAAVDGDTARALAMVHPARKIRIRVSDAAMTPEGRAELERDLAEMREDLRREQAELQRELREAELERRESLREAELERRQALHEAEQERQEAVREAEQERQEALREAAHEAELERQQARREAAQAAREALIEAEQARREAEAERRRARH